MRLTLQNQKHIHHAETPTHPPLDLVPNIPVPGPMIFYSVDDPNAVERVTTHSLSSPGALLWGSNLRPPGARSNRHVYPASKIIALHDESLHSHHDWASHQRVLDWYLPAHGLMDIFSQCRRPIALVEWVAALSHSAEGPHYRGSQNIISAPGLGRYI